MDRKAFGKRLKKLRLSKNLKAKEFGEIFSLAESTISGYENGNRKPDMETLNKFADFFNVSMDYLYGREKENESLFFFNIEGLTEEEIEDIKNHIDYVKWKSKEKREENV